MKQDVFNWANQTKGGKLPSKETLNHRAWIEQLSGKDIYRHTAECFQQAYAALGIDIVNRVPLHNAPQPAAPGQQRRDPHKPYTFTSLGVYDTAFRHTYLCATPEDIWHIDAETLLYEDLITPVPHPCRAADIRRRQHALGEIGVYYPMLYTTLFMWAVEFFGWEVFMVNAISRPQQFHEQFLKVFAAKSRAIVEDIAAASDAPFVFLHDDLADANGPVFPPSWYDDYIFPHYPDIVRPAKERGKKIMFVADGNMTAFLPKLVEAGVDGIMFENPATPTEAVIEHFGQTGRYFIGGVETLTLTQGTPDEVRRMVMRLARQCADYSGFAIASCGGLHDNIPLDNLTAYFDARAEIGATPKDWKTLVKDRISV